MTRKAIFQPINIITLTIVLFVIGIEILVRASFTSRERAQKVGDKVVAIVQKHKSQTGCVPPVIEGEDVEHLGESLYSLDSYNIVYKATSDTSYIICVIIDDTEQTTYDSASGSWN